MANIIIKDKTKFGYTRSEQEHNLRREGMSSLSEAQLDYCKYIEKKYQEKTGSKQNFVRQDMIGGDNGMKDAE